MGTSYLSCLKYFVKQLKQGFGDNHKELFTVAAMVLWIWKFIFGNPFTSPSQAASTVIKLFEKEAWNNAKQAASYTRYALHCFPEILEIVPDYTPPEADNPSGHDTEIDDEKMDDTTMNDTKMDDEMTQLSERLSSMKCDADNEHVLAPNPILAVVASEQNSWLWIEKLITHQVLPSSVGFQVIATADCYPGHVLFKGTDYEDMEFILIKDATRSILAVQYYQEKDEDAGDIVPSTFSGYSMYDVETQAYVALTRLCGYPIICYAGSDAGTLPCGSDFDMFQEIDNVDIDDTTCVSVYSIPQLMRATSTNNPTNAKGILQD